VLNDTPYIMIHQRVRDSWR